ncbi:hypothetical protein [Thioclava sp. GXIMD4215]|uniref:hypothetical protein n=1 Tax=Thioclava sp. GXIMD4215 TaxID=3131928 RepID=UPI00324868CD
MMGLRNYIPDLDVLTGSRMLLITASILTFVLSAISQEDPILALKDIALLNALSLPQIAHLCKLTTIAALIVFWLQSLFVLPVEWEKRGYKQIWSMLESQEDYENWLIRHFERREKLANQGVPASLKIDEINELTQILRTQQKSILSSETKGHFVESVIVKYLLPSAIAVLSLKYPSLLAN